MDAAVCGVILAGGQGRRMGGADKALLPLAGRPLIAHVAGRIAPQVGSLAISANGDPARFRALLPDCPVLPDRAGQQGEGPLAGIVNGLSWAHAQGADLLLSVPVDTPFLPRDLIARLIAGGAGDLGAIAASGGRVHPSVALWPVARRDQIAALFAAGERRLRRAAQGAAVVEFAQALDPFVNLNTPDDLERAESRAVRGAT